MFIQHKKTAGFTLIEMLVSLALFTVVITIVTGALLVLISGNGRLQNEQSVMTNLTFALDTMTREIRTGTQYVCTSSSNAELTSYGTTSVNDCASGNNGLSFREAGTSITGGVDNGRIAYYYDSTNKTIMRRVDTTIESIVSSGIVITNLDFFVTDARSFTDNGSTRQPTVTVIIEAEEEGVTGGKTFRAQTTVTQRQLDI